MTKALYICKPTDRRGILNVAFVNLFTYSSDWVELRGNVGLEFLSVPSLRYSDTHNNWVLRVEAKSQQKLFVEKHSRSLWQLVLTNNPTATVRSWTDRRTVSTKLQMRSPQIWKWRVMPWCFHSNSILATETVRSHLAYPSLQQHVFLPVWLPEGHRV
jgi:hypothetical protein